MYMEMISKQTEAPTKNPKKPNNTMLIIIHSLHYYVHIDYLQ